MTWLLGGKVWSRLNRLVIQSVAVKIGPLSACRYWLAWYEMFCVVWHSLGLFCKMRYINEMIIKCGRRSTVQGK